MNKIHPVNEKSLVDDIDMMVRDIENEIDAVQRQNEVELSSFYEVSKEDINIHRKEKQEIDRNSS